MKEPRGHIDMCGAIWLPPCRPEADMGVLFIDVIGYLPMCGHSTIGTVTALVESGRIPITGDVMDVVLDTPAGLVRTKAYLENGHVVRVAFRNIPSFVYASGKLTVPGYGEVAYDVAYGGNQYAITEAAPFNLELKPERLKDILKAGMEFARVVSKEVPFLHPEKPWINRISHVMFTAPPQTPEGTHRGTVIVLPEDLENGLPAYDRSPCGTGTSARAALMYRKGEIGLNEEFVHESIINTRFRAKIVEEALVGGKFEGGIPEVAGRANVTGLHTFIIDPDDMLKDGFLVG
jgi:proline racemase